MRLFLLILIFIPGFASALNDSTFLITLSKQQALIKNAEIVSHNIANSDTAGFKSSHLIDKVHTQNNIGEDQYANYVSYIDFSDSALTPTDNPFSVAIRGDAFFMVVTPNGQKFTRNGNFVVDNRGLLTTEDGYPVLNSERSNIEIGNNIKSFLVKQNGQIILNDVAIGSLASFTVEDKKSLKQIAHSLYDANEADMVPSKNFSFVQGYVEQSNINKVREMTKLIELERDIQITSNLIGAYNEISRNMISTLGKTQ